MGFLPDGRLSLATALDKKLVTVDTERGELTEVADLSDLAQGTLNDMVVDERGRAYVGDVGFQFGNTRNSSKSGDSATYCCGRG